MDPRIEDHAELLVDHCTDVQRGDMVAVMAPPAAADLEVAIYEALGERGAMPIGLSLPRRAMRAYAAAIDADDVQMMDHALAFVEETDVMIGIRGAANVSEMNGLDPEEMQAFAKVQKPIQDAQMQCRWVGTQFPAPGNAQKAEMNTDDYRDFVWNAVNKDWDEQREFQAQMVEILDDAEEVRIVSGEETDLTMSVAGNPTKNDDAEHNLPGGEVFTAPVPDSVEGTVCFDKPVMGMGREIRNASLEFEGGEVVHHDAEQNADVLAGIVGTDEGAKRLGELGIGMNRDIDRFTYNMLFDEKMGDTVHLAIGRAYAETVGEGNEQNESAVHKDMIVDMSEDSFIEVDGEVVQRDGTFVFEDGFEG
ncbi:aminopeptidase [Halobacterium wangiae]|uniref:aminopeptidase n=1 Tax=Halobacterium wangiae TaxID=2902623 RepID=UPI001E4C1C1E|nr:aminopeptidase [Halobacterium wangiae]